MSFRIQSCDSMRPVDPDPGFNPPYVVVGNIPLSAIDYDLQNGTEKLSDHPISDTCPQFSNLGAFSIDSPLEGSDQKQPLSVPCLYRADAEVGGTAYPICVLKTAKLVDMECIPSEWLTEGAKYNRVGCSLVHLGGTVMRRGKQVKVVLNSTDPFELPPIETF